MPENFQINLILLSGFDFDRQVIGIARLRVREMYWTSMLVKDLRWQRKLARRKEKWRTLASVRFSPQPATDVFRRCS